MSDDDFIEMAGCSWKRRRGQNCGGGGGDFECAVFALLIFATAFAAAQDDATSSLLRQALGKEAESNRHNGGKDLSEMIGAAWAGRALPTGGRRRRH